MDTRPEPPTRGDETETSLGFLTWLRLAVIAKTDGLRRDQLLVTHPPSTITLLGLIKHLAFVEDYWCGYVLSGVEPGPPWDDAPWDSIPTMVSVRSYTNTCRPLYASPPHMSPS